MRSFGQKQNQPQEMRSSGDTRSGSSTRDLTARERSLLRVQAGAGNHAVQRVMQRKLAVNRPGDAYEQEADRVAAQVMRMPVSGAGAPLRIQRLSAGSGGQAESAPASVDQVLASPGAPLEPGLQGVMEQRFGADFGAVRTHTGPDAAQSAQEVNALAYTVGHDMVFGAGRFTPGTHEGQRLLAHELTHVVQQDQGKRYVQRWAYCTPARLSAEDCPPRVTGEAKTAQSGPMVFLPGLKDPTTGDQGVLIANFDIASSAIKPNLHESLYWKQFLTRIAANRSRWTLRGFTDCQGGEKLNQKLRKDRAAAVLNVLPPGLKPQIVSTEGAPMHECVTENDSAADRTLNRSVALVLHTSVADFEGEEIAVCIPPTPQQSSGKRCKFYVYDNTEPTGMAWKWKTAAFALASPRPGAYVIPSGDNIEEALKGILDTYAMKDCGCTEEVQFWSHGSSGNAMSVSKSNDELTAKDFNIPGLKQFGYGPRSLPGYQEWHSKLSTRQRRLVLLRRTICDSDAEIYYRSCEAFKGKEGQEFARASTEFWQSNVVGHTKVIALTQPGKKVLKPCQQPYWSETEGTEAPSPKKPIGVGAEQKPKK